MPVPTRLTDFSTTAASNSPQGSDSIGNSLDDYLRAYQAVTRLDLASKGADIASAATTDIGAVGGLMHDITGTTTITSFGTVAAGVWKILKYEGSLSITHNATSLILLGGADRTTANGDTQIVISEGSGNWREIAYFRAATPPVTNSAMPKAWALFVGADGTVTSNYNVTGVTRNGTGDYSVTFDTDFADTNYCPVISINDASSTGNNGLGWHESSKAVGSYRFVVGIAAGVATDPTSVSVMFFGNQ